MSSVGSDPFHLSLTFDKKYYDRLYGTVSTHSSDTFDRFTPPMTNEMRVRFGGDVEKNNKESFFSTTYRDSLYGAIFNKPRPAASDNLFSFRPSHHPSLNSIQEDMSRKGEGIEEECKKIVPIVSKTLDAPNLHKDFYTSLLDVSAQNSMIVALGDTLYIKSRIATQNKIEPIFLGNEDGSDENNLITCVHSIGKTETIFNGLFGRKIVYVDSETDQTSTPERCLQHHVTCATSGKSPALFYVGDFNGSILKTDLRTSLHPDVLLEDVIGSITGLSLAEDETKLAVGTNDDKIKVLDLRRGDLPCITFDCFKAAVKALEWSPWQRNILFAGGGTGDPAIRILSTESEGEVIFENHSIGRQVTGIHACNKSREIISCHGYNGGTTIVWDFHRNHIIPKIELKEHSGRILHSALNSEKTKLLTLSEDETLKIWELNNNSTKDRPRNTSAIFDNPLRSIR